MFTAATDVEPMVNQTIEEPITEVFSKAGDISGSGWEFTYSALLQQKRDQIVATLAKEMNSSLIKKSRALYWSANHDRRIVCTISKRYVKRNSYWYAYHPQWDAFLSEASDGRLVLGCMDLAIAFAIPRPTIHSILSDLNTTELDRGIYWHLHIVEVEPGSFELLTPKKSANFELAKFKVMLNGA
jgi:hypothetical protein